MTIEAMWEGIGAALESIGKTNSNVACQLSYIIAVTMKNPNYSGATKDNLSVPSIVPVIKALTQNKLKDFLKENPN